MNTFFRSLSPAMRSILAGRLRLRYSYLFPETNRGYLGISRPRTKLSPPTFKEFATKELGISSGYLHSLTSTYTALNEPILRKVIGTTADQSSKLVLMKRLGHPEKVTRYFERTAEPIESPPDPGYLVKIAAFVDSLAPSDSTLSQEIAHNQHLERLVPSMRLANGSRHQRDILRKVLLKCGIPVESNSVEAVKAAMADFAEQL